MNEAQKIATCGKALHDSQYLMKKFIQENPIKVRAKQDAFMRIKSHLIDHTYTLPKDTGHEIKDHKPSD